MRLRCGRSHFSGFTRDEAGVIERLLEMQDGITEVRASFRTGGILVKFLPSARDDVLTAVSLIDRSYLEGESLPSRYEGGVAMSAFALFGRGLAGRLLPLPVRVVVSAIRFIPFLFTGVKSLLRGKLDISVLDASAIGASLLLGELSTASTIMTMLSFGDVLESWTKERSKRRLAEGLAMNEATYWVERDGVQIQIPSSDLCLGDDVVVRAGTVVPVDGRVVRGDAMVNQSVMTGEPLAVHRRPRDSVFAGTVVEEGELLVRNAAFDKATRISRIMEMIEESGMKAEIEGKAERLADAVVPYSFLLAGLVFIFTGSLRKAASALLVDYSCAIKLSTPLAILSAMREGAREGVVVKGGRILEKIAEADTVVFDKTGTLSVASPSVAMVVPFDGWTREQVLRTAACLEEHFPHSIARAVVKRAEEENLMHREEHADVEYAVAHGIVSRIGSTRLIIGSEHFVLEDEKIQIGEKEAAIVRGLARHYSLLYLATGCKLAGVICVEDALRDEAAGVVRDLRAEGIKNILMLTGDNSAAAEDAASRLGLDSFHAMLLPEQKTERIKDLRALGAKVIMIGDGINDSPALGAADVGFAMKEGADIAREVADVVLTSGDLKSVVSIRRISTGVMSRIRGNYVFIIAVNSAFLALGLSGAITPALTALLHNASTIGASVRSMRPILKNQGNAD